MPRNDVRLRLLAIGDHHDKEWHVISPSPSSATQPERQEAGPDLLPRPRASHVIGQVAATLTVTLALSFLGTAGTLIGLSLGAALSAVLPTAYENLVRRSQHKARLLRERQRRAGASTSAAGDYEFLYVAAEPAAASRISLPWRRMAVAAVAVFALCAGTVTVIEAFAGKPMSAVVTGRHGSGYTFSGGHSGPGDATPLASRRHHSPAPATTPTANPSPAASSSAPAGITPSPTSTPAPPSSPPVSPSPPASSSPPAPAPSSG